MQNKYAQYVPHYTYTSDIECVHAQEIPPECWDNGDNWDDEYPVSILQAAMIMVAGFVLGMLSLSGV